MSKFKKEDRYMVLKGREVSDYLTEKEQIQLGELLSKVREGRYKAGKSILECVVIESDWSVYEDAWKLVEKEYYKDNQKTILVNGIPTPITEIDENSAREYSIDLSSTLDLVEDLAPKMSRVVPKDRMTLLPMDILRKYVIDAYEEGVLKYSRESWRKGFVVSELVDAAFRHLEVFFWQGEDFDQETLETYNIHKHHLAGAIFSCLSILHTLEVRPRLDDRGVICASVYSEEVKKKER